MQYDLHLYTYVLTTIQISHILSIQKTGIKLQNSSNVMNFIDVAHFTMTGSKLCLYSLKMALSCRNMLEWSDYNAFSWYIKWKYLDKDVPNEKCSAVFVV